MRKCLLLFFASLLLTVSALAVPVDCQFETPRLSDLMNPAGIYVDGCFVQDKLFSNFGYVQYTQGGTGNPDATLVEASFGLTLGPNPPAGDLHEIRFEAVGSSWAVPFLISYDVSLYNPPVGLSIVKGYFDISVPGGGNLATGTKTLVGTNDTYTIVATVGSPGESSINSESFLAVTENVNPNGENVTSLVNSFTQGAIPEPGTWALLGGGLVLLCALRRRKEKA